MNQTLPQILTDHRPRPVGTEEEGPSSTIGTDGTHSIATGVNPIPAPPLQKTDSHDLVVHEDGVAPPVSFTSLFKFSESWKDHVLLVFGLIFSFLDGAIPAAFTIMMGLILDLFSAHGQGLVNDTDFAAKVAMYIYILLGFGGAKIVFQGLSWWCMTLTSLQRASRFRHTYFDGLLSQEPGWFDVHNIHSLGASISRYVVCQNGRVGPGRAILYRL